MPLPINQTELKNLFTDLKHRHVIIEERLTQHPEMVFGNNSINTIRAYTIYDNNSDKVFILKTVLRVGIGDSIVDNSHSGGCAYEVDKENGYIISPYYRSDGSSEYIHPQTGICMLGKQIPQWDNVTGLICKAAKLIPQCRLIGWDVAITPHGPVLIEGNHNPDLDMIEFVGSHGYRDLIYRHLNLI